MPWKPVKGQKYVAEMTFRFLEGSATDWGLCEAVGKHVLFVTPNNKLAIPLVLRPEVKYLPSCTADHFWSRVSRFCGPSPLMCQTWRLLLSHMTGVRWGHDLCTHKLLCRPILATATATCDVSVCVYIWAVPSGIGNLHAHDHHGAQAWKVWHEVCSSTWNTLNCKYLRT